MTSIGSRALHQVITRGPRTLDAADPRVGPNADTAPAMTNRKPNVLR